MNDTLLFIIATLLMLGGIAGVIVPALPGIPFMFLVALGFTLIDGFSRLVGLELGILGGLAVISLIVDYLAGTLGAKISGASPKSLGAGLIGLVAGTLLAPPFGGILGLFLGIFGYELSQRRTRQQALKAATGGLIGSLAGIIINLILALGFLIAFILFVI